MKQLKSLNKGCYLFTEIDTRTSLNVTIINFSIYFEIYEGYFSAAFFFIQISNVSFFIWSHFQIKSIEQSYGLLNCLIFNDFVKHLLKNNMKFNSATILNFSSRTITFFVKSILNKAFKCIFPLQLFKIDAKVVYMWAAFKYRWLKKLEWLNHQIAFERQSH